jgi:nucleotidyltransferase substrate binding protein (TIGR01987 family)
MQLDFSSFKKALASLNRALQRSQTAPGDEELRDAVIQRFEYTYELSWKMLKRQLEQESPTPAQIDQLSYRDLLREAAQAGIIPEVERWMDYRELRNITAHTYDDLKAQRVYDAVDDFYTDASALLKALEERRHD